MRASLSRMLCGLTLLSVLGSDARGAEQAPPPEDQPRFERIGQGDPRIGYESPQFRTRSASIVGATGVRADLAGLAAAPPLGLPPLAEPPQAALIDLGRQLFFDRRLSGNDTISCGMCHVPEQAFTQNELATPVGIEGRFVRRNAPALYNVGYRQRLFHDGRETRLGDQIWSPLLAANEMGNASQDGVLQKLAAVDEYADAFDSLFEDGLTAENLGQALAAYQTALLSADSPFDRWFYAGRSDAMPAEAKAGFAVFVQSGCGSCHLFSNVHAHFTDDRLHRTGVEFASRQREARPPDVLQIAPGVSIPVSSTIVRPARNDEGLQEITGRPEDRWRYRTPSLRNVAITAPYMHDGSFRTLAAVIDFYDGGGGDDPARDPRLRPLGLTDAQKQNLVALLEALTGANVDALTADARSAPIGDRRADTGGNPAPGGQSSD